MTIPPNKILIPGIAAIAIVVMVVAAFLGVKSGAAYNPSDKEITRKLERSHGIAKPAERKLLGKRDTSDDVNWGNVSTGESRALLPELKRLLDSGDEMKIVDAIQDAQRLSGPELIDFVSYVLKTQKDPNTRWDALGLVGKLSSKEVIPTLEQGIEDENEIVRTTAVEAIAQFNDSRENALNELAGKTELTDQERALLESQTLTNEDMRRISSVLMKAMNDKEADVVRAAVGNLEQLHGDLQIIALDAGLHSENAGVRKQVLDTISVHSNKDTIWLVFDALKDADEGTSGHAQELLEHAFGKKFTNAAEAARWWQENQDKYDYDLIEKNMGSDE